jgi:hypothetical protein
MLVEHIDRLVELLRKAGERSVVDASVFPAVQVGTDAVGVAADLMQLDRLAAAERFRLFPGAA